MAEPASLAARFVEGLGAGLRTPDEATLEAQLRALVERGRQAWPALTLAPHAFVDRLARHASAQKDPQAYLQGVAAEDLYLACALSAGEPAALDVFEREHLSQVPAYVLRVTVDRDQVDELKQRLRQSVLFGDGGAPRILEYAGTGALGGWVRVVAVRTALNLLRSEPPTARSEPADEEPLVALDPELAYVKAETQHVFAQAFSRVLAALEPKERSLLRLHYVEGLTLERLSSMFRVPRSTLHRRMAELRDEILEATRAQLEDEHRLSPTEVASLLRAASSRVHLTLGRLLKD